MSPAAVTRPPRGVRGRRLALSWWVAAVWAGALGVGVLLWAGPRPSSPADPGGPGAAAWDLRPSAAGLPAAGQPTGPRHGQLAFTIQTGGPITGQPAVAPDGRVYFGSHDGTLRAVGRGGELLWRRFLGAPVHAGPALHGGGLILVGTDAGELWAFDRDGDRRLRAELGGPIDTAPLPLPDGGIACAAGATLWGLEADGRERFRFRTHGKIFGPPVLAAGGVAFGAQDHHLYVVDLHGAQRFAVDLGSDVDGGPALASDGALVTGADDGVLRALSPLDGHVLWTRRLGPALRSAPAVAGRRLVVATHGLRPALHLLDGRTGRPLSRLGLGLSDSPQLHLRGAPRVDAAGRVYVGTRHDGLIAFDPHGRELFRVPAAGRVGGTPALAADGTLYFGSDDGRLYAVRDR
ncbi:MAG: PQQ-binding-like beta-propeller repeat protein [Myxococcales bacterium]|jgi:outer membrane protein assembly factor BamB